MKESTPKEQILTKVRNALIDKSDNPYQDIDYTAEVLKPKDTEEAPEVAFAGELIATGGHFIYCENENAFAEYLSELLNERQWPAVWCVNPRIAQLLELSEIPHYEADPPQGNPIVGITAAEKLISRTGSIVISELLAGSRRMISLPDIHLVLAYSSQVTQTLKTAFAEIRLKYNESLPSQLTVVTGPSRTADIEKTLVMGAHGPKELFVFMIDDL